MKRLVLTASMIALFSATAQAQLVGGLGGSIGGSLGATIDSAAGSTLDTAVARTTRAARGTVDGSASSDGEKSVDARNGRVSARRKDKASVTASSASLADLAVPTMASGSASGQGSAEGSAEVGLIGAETLGSKLAPTASQGRRLVAENRESLASAAQTAAGAVPSLAIAPGSGNAQGEARATGSAASTLSSTPLAVAGSALASGEGAASLSPGMPVLTPDGRSHGEVHQVVADSRGQVQQLVVSQGKLTRTLPASMFSIRGDALIAGQARATGSSGSEPGPQPEPAR